MTRTEAIKIWQYVKDHPTYDGDIVPIVQEACDMAIKALEFLDKIADTYGNMLDIPTQEQAVKESEICQEKKLNQS